MKLNSQMANMMLTIPMLKIVLCRASKTGFLICIWILNPRELPSFCIWNYSRPNCLGSCKEVKYLACKCWYSISGFSLLQLSNTNTNIFKYLACKCWYSQKMFNLAFLYHVHHHGRHHHGHYPHHGNRHHQFNERSNFWLAYPQSDPTLKVLPGCACFTN